MESGMVYPYHVAADALFGRASRSLRSPQLNAVPLARQMRETGDPMTWTKTLRERGAGFIGWLAENGRLQARCTLLFEELEQLVRTRV
jgi:hypothetical protein